jgi:hypothetical protein
LWATPHTPPKPTCGIKWYIVLDTIFFVPSNVTPGQFNLNMVDQLVKQTVQNTAVKIAPFALGQA